MLVSTLASRVVPAIVAILCLLPITTSLRAQLPEGMSEAEFVEQILGRPVQPREGTDAQDPPPVDDEVAYLETDHGALIIALHEDSAPKHVEAFSRLVAEGFYDETRFHRCIQGFIIQGGCPNTREDDRLMWGLGDPGFRLDAEFNNRPFLRRSVGMARVDDNPNSAGSQFFICVEEAQHLNRDYTNIGNVILGMEVVDIIDGLPRVQGDDQQPKEPAVVRRARMMSRGAAIAAAAHYDPNAPAQTDDEEPATDETPGEEE